MFIFQIIKFILALGCYAGNYNGARSQAIGTPFNSVVQGANSNNVFGNVDKVYQGTDRNNEHPSKEEDNSMLPKILSTLNPALNNSNGGVRDLVRKNKFEGI